MESKQRDGWGTLGELLLACAVNRHGTNSWDSIADELKKRLKHNFSPHTCKLKYVDLTRRFNPATIDVKNREDEQLLRVVEELRKLRVEELKREVKSHDHSIVSLQLKVKRLKEEREEPDLRIEPDENATVTTDKTDEPDKSAEKVAIGDSVQDRSFNESNETNHNIAENNKGD